MINWTLNININTEKCRFEDSLLRYADIGRKKPEPRPPLWQFTGSAMF